MDYPKEFTQLVSEQSAVVLGIIASELTVRKDVVRKMAVENSISMYQETGVELDFILVKAIYEPERYSWRWRERYSHLFDSTEDFDSVYEECFVRACRGYADEAGRKSLGIEVMGNGSFNNYFYGVLGNTFANIMKSKSCESRNPGLRCPACDAIVAPLNTHVLRDHSEYADSIVSEIVGKQGTKPWICSLCPAYARKMKFEDKEDLRKHVVAKHSTAVFERFSREHPNHSMAMREPATSGGLLGREDNEVKSLSSHDAIEQTASSGINQNSMSQADAEYSRVDLGHAIIVAGFSNCQLAMIDCVLDDGRASHLPSRNKLCEACVYLREGGCRNGGKLSRDQYVNEVNGLRTKMKGVLNGTGMA